MLNLFDKYTELKSRTQIRKLYKYAEEINALEKSFSQMSDSDLQNKTIQLKEALKNGKTLLSVRAEAFALVREGAKRTLGMRHYDVQMLAGLVMSDGNIGQMQTGEGKTLAASLPSFLFALEGKGVHVITSNEYLAKRDFELIGQVHRFLGLTVGLNLSKMDPSEKKNAYMSDITYGTGNEFGFDYLRDNMISSLSERTQRAHSFAIIDEIDSVLIDEARTPLIIANKSNVSSELYEITSLIAQSFKQGTDIEVNLPFRQVHLLDEGIEKIEKTFGVDNLYSADHQVLYHCLHQTLQAHFILKRDRDYIIKNGKAELVDAFTGRVLEGRNLSNGLHQAIEAKEGLKINDENITQASVTIQNYFRMYSVLCGTTGSALPAQKEFLDVYALDVIEIPTNRPNIRIDHPEVLFRSLDDKYTRIAEEIAAHQKVGRPVLIGTTSIFQSENLSAFLNEKGMKHSLLNAKTEEQEAGMIAAAGQKGQVTIATNMAGRGTDILLGEGVAELGGLHIIGTERHESKRIDMQLRGRAGRQGDPGSSIFIISLQDDLLNQYDDDDLKKWTKKVKCDENGSVISPDPVKFIEKVQETIENTHFSSRVHLLKLEDVLDQQRKAVYGIRNGLLTLENPLTFIEDSLKQTIKEWISDCMTQDGDKDVQKLHLQLSEILPFKTTAQDWTDMDEDEVEEHLFKDVVYYKLMIQEHLSDETTQNEMKHYFLHSLDQAWIEHLEIMHELKDGIHLRSYSQEDPYRLFQLEGYEAYEDMLRSYRLSSLKSIMQLYNRTKEKEGAEA